MKQFVWIACVMYFVNGLAVVMLGPILPELLAHYHWSYAEGGYLVLVQSLGFLVGVPLSTVAIRRMGYKPLLAGLSLVIAIALAVLATLPPAYALVIASICVSLCVSASESVIATYTMEAFVGRRAVVMSYLEVAFGLGALAMPSIASVLIKWNAWNLGFAVVAVLALGTFGVWLLTRLSEHQTASLEPLDAANAAPTATTRSARASVLSLFLVMIFFYVGTESSLGNFLPAVFIPVLHVSAPVASLSVATLWIAMVLGRIATGWIIRKVPYVPFLSWSAGASGVLLLLLCVFRQPAVCYAIVLLLGFFMSGLFSITLVYANHTVPDAQRLVTSLMTMSSGMGGAVLPALVGFTMSHAPIDRGLWLIAGFMVAMFIVLMAVIATGRRHHLNSDTTFSQGAVNEC